MEYDYDVHAETGKVLMVEKDELRRQASDEATSTTDSPITEEAEAIAIAIAHAGLTLEQVRLNRTEYESERGIPKYEVEFYHDGWEYQYDVHAETGEILAFEKDWDD